MVNVFMYSFLQNYLHVTQGHSLGDTECRIVSMHRAYGCNAREQNRLML